MKQSLCSECVQNFLLHECFAMHMMTCQILMIGQNTRGVTKWRLVSVRLEMVLTSTQDRNTVCAEHTIESEMSLVQLMVLLGDVGEVEARFSLFGDTVNLDKR